MSEGGPSLVDLTVDDPRWAVAFPVLAELRPHLDAGTFAALHAAGAPQGLTFTGAFDEERCLGVAGWRILHTANVVKKLYVDDLVVAASARSSGVGARLLAHLEDRARAAGCRTLELDSGHHRGDAHRFYLREGYTDTSRHFAKDLTG